MSLRALFWTLLAQIIGGSTPALTKLALGGSGPWTLVASRQVLGLIVLLALARVTGRGAPARFDRRDWALLVTLAWAGFALPVVLLTFGIARSSAINGALLAPVEPIGIALGGALLLGERLTAHGLAGLALGTAGATLIVLGSQVTPQAGDLLGDSLIFAGYLAWSVYTLAAKPLLERHAAQRVTVWAVALGIPPLALMAAAEQPLHVPPPATLGWTAVLAVVSTVLGPYAWNRALQLISAGTMAVFIFVQPLVGLMIGVLLLDEPFGTLALVGAVLIAAGVVPVALRRTPSS